MEIQIQHTSIDKVEADALVVNLFAGVTTPSGATGALNASTQGWLLEQIRQQQFTGEVLESLIVYNPPHIKAKFIIVIGLGNAADFTLATARKVAAASIGKARELKAKSLATIVHGAGIGNLPVKEAAQMLAEGLLLGAYQFLRYKSQEKDKPQSIQKVIIAETDEVKISDIEAGISEGEAIAEAILFARNLVNEPPTHVKPQTLANTAKTLAEGSTLIKATILDEAALRQEQYNALLAVASGSEEKPYLIHLHYKPRRAKRSIAFIGKGVTFDSGGLGIKPAGGMRTMKTDMAGAATVLGIFQALINLEQAGNPVGLEVHGVIPTTENMISGKAMRPDDIITTKSGKTIEIAHTDAEGRLILADALLYTQQFAPNYMVDYATLTGAAIRALGRSYSVYMGNNRQLLDLINSASNQTGELAWELPLPKLYRSYIDSPIADIQNIASSDDAPGAIIGGLFLQEFVNDIPWAHIDIAGPAWQEENNNPVYPKGATGYGILLGLRLLELI